MTPRLPLLAAIVALGTTTLAAPCAALDAPNVAYIYDTDTVARDAFGTMLRDQLSEVEDVVTEDLLVEILRGTEKDMWFLESHLNV